MDSFKLFNKKLNNFILQPTQQNWKIITGPAVRREPPPHPRRCSDSSLKVGTTTVVGRIRRRAYYFRRCKKVPANNIESLPDEVLSEILVRLSAEEICENARFVCRNWYHIIHSDAFINAHREYSNRGLLLSSLYRSERPLFLGVRQGRIEISELYHSSYFPIRASCNGLVSSIKPSKPYTINIINLATKQAFSLPPSIPPAPGEFLHGTFDIAYAAASMEYKLVRTYKSRGLTRCHILTVGVDNDWRCVGVDNLSCGAKKLLLENPLTTQGFMHWTWKWEGTRVLTLNAETEMFAESYVPLLPHPVDDDGDSAGYERLIRRKCKFYMSTGRRLSLLFACGDLVWEVWEMEGESGEWRKLLPNIDLGSHKQSLGGFIEPLGWIKYPVLLALYYFFGSICIVYNLDSDEVDYIELPQPGRNYKAVVHRNTLEWLS